MSIEAMKQALAALGLVDDDIEWQERSITRKVVLKAITALRTAIAEAEKADYADEADTEELLEVSKLPEPLRLAAMLEKTAQWPLHGKAADCLRQMYAAQGNSHDVNAELLEALKVLLSAVEGNHVTVGDCNQAKFAIKAAESIQ